MNYRVVLLIAAVVTLAALGSAAQADTGLKTITESGITVWYAPNMEVQAKRVMQMAKSSLGPSIESHRKTVNLLAKTDAMAKDIATLLGADERQDEVRAKLKSYRDKSQALVQCFSSIRLVKKADAAGANGVDAGFMRVAYNDDTDEFNITMASDLSDPDTLKRTYFPVLVNADGTIRSESKLMDMAVSFLGSGDPMIIAPVHQTVGFMISEQLQFYHPIARWFNEGVSGWVTRYIVNKYDPKLSNIASMLFNVDARSKEYRDKINLLAWPQPAFQNKNKDFFDAKLEVAQTQYAVEMISDFLGKNGAQVLPKIMSEAKYGANPDTNAICEKVTKVTGRDFKDVISTYVPSDIKAGIDAGENKKLVAEAKKLALEKSWAPAIEKLRRALQIDPEDSNARVNLAWIERETGERLDSEIQTFLAASLFKKQAYQFHLFAPSAEGNYVAARLAILLGDLDSAKQFLEPVLQANPDHQDAKRAMEEISKVEGATKS